MAPTPKGASKKATKKAGSKASSSRAASPAVPTTATAPPSSGYLLTCDPPTKQFIKYLNETKLKKFIIEELDATHLLIDGSAREEILRKVEDWMDENVFTNVERVGENLET
jgi:TFIIH basal transcription factor complex TTD-A subunit